MDEQEQGRCSDIPKKLYKGFYNYQTTYNGYYYDTANEAFGKVPDEYRAAVLEQVKDIAKNAAADQMLARYNTSTGTLEKYGDVKLSDVAIFKVYVKKADAENTAVDEKTGKPKSNGSYDQKEITAAIRMMDWLTPHEMAILWQSMNSNNKNNPWKKYL